MKQSSQLAYYLRGQSTSLLRYSLEQTLYTLFGWVPGLLGIGLRGIAYRTILHSDGFPIIEHHVRLATAPTDERPLTGDLEPALTPVGVLQHDPSHDAILRDQRRRGYASSRGAASDSRGEPGQSARKRLRSATKSVPRARGGVP